MTGHDVLHPMGWDAFGLPAENAAIERAIHPEAWTTSNISKMKEQLNGMGGQFDWDKEFMTCSPSFYKHTQQIFLMLYERGLAYQAEAMVNYDPVDKTVLANEQVDMNGNSWRSGAKVERIMLKQWFLRITAFQNELLEGIESLLRKGTWPERVLVQQKHWLGKSEGAKICFPVRGDTTGLETIEVFTTRPDTLFGVQFLALSLNHPIVTSIAKKDAALKAFIEASSDLPPESKAGYRLPDVYALNPINGRNNDVSKAEEEEEEEARLPIFAAPYVLGDYGEGAVMGVPGHDTRDWAFWAQRGQGQKPKLVISLHHEDKSIPEQATLESAYTQQGILTGACGEYAGLTSMEGGQAIVKTLQQSQQASFAQKWRLRDWLISRQRYWGTPIPIIHCNDCGAVPVPVEHLPVELPNLTGMPPGVTGSPLQHVESWVNTTCPKCHGQAKRDTDTMDTFVDSSWYYMRFPDASNKERPFSLQSAGENLPVDIYIGGVEHAILHLLYARFIYKFLVSEGHIPRPSSSSTSTSPSSTIDQGLIEPFRRVISQGMVHGKTYSDPATGRFLLPSEVEISSDGNPTIKSSGIKPNISWEKMSKSKRNGVDPSHCISKYGADVTRAHMLFSAPVSEVLEWDEEKIVGIQRWFGRMTRLVDDVVSRQQQQQQQSSHSSIQSDSTSPSSTFDLTHDLLTNPSSSTLTNADVNLLLTVNETILSVTRTFSENPYALNTAISDLIKLTNTLISSSVSSSPTSSADNTTTTTQPPILLTSLSILLRLLWPIAPSFTQTAWSKLRPYLASTSTITTTTTTTSSSAPPAAIPPTPSPFPTPLLTASQTTALRARFALRRPCAVQINGKFRFAVAIAGFPGRQTASTDDEDYDDAKEQKSEKAEEEDWILSQLMHTQDGADWLGEKKLGIVVGAGEGDREGERPKRWRFVGKRMVIVGGGRVVNFVV